MAGGNKGFADALAGDLDEAVVEAANPAEGIMASRSQALARLASGKVVTDRTEFLDPERCRPWRLHNRDLDHLNEDSCRDLIDAFMSAKKQRIPAIVRRLTGDPDYDFEIIAGVRRWWTVRWLRANNHPEFDYLVTIQKMTDEEAFRVSDVENRSRKDITDWERAREYTTALAEFYGGAQSRMAEHLNISKSWLSRLIDVARLPPEIVAAFADPHDITVRVARDIKPLTADKRALGQMVEEGRATANERAQTGIALSGPETAKRLVRATIAPTKRAPKQALTDRRSETGKPMLRYAREGQGGKATLQVLPHSGASRANMVNEIVAALEDMGILPAT
jgi:ParB family transcriptional regulator, chromosome partitioning protein